MFVLFLVQGSKVTPKPAHLHAVKRIFRYIKGQPTLGLWYPRDLPFDLEAFSDSDYAGDCLECKSHLRIEESSILTQTKHIEIRYHFIRDSYEKNLIQVIKIHTDKNVADLLTKAFDVSRMGTLKIWYCIKRRLQIVMKRRCDINHKWVGGEAVHKELGDRMERAATTASSSEAKHDSGSGPMCKDTILGDVDAQTRRKQRKEAKTAHVEIEEEEHFNTPSNDPLPSGEDIMQLNELMVLCTQLQQQVLNLENAKSDHAIEIASLKKRVDKLEKRRQLRTTGLTRFNKFGTAKRVKSSNASLGAQEDASKQGRSIEDIDADAERFSSLVGCWRLEEATGSAGIQEEEANIALIESWENTQAMDGSDRLWLKDLIKEQREKKAKGSKETAKGNRKKMLRRKRVGKQQQQESSKKQKMEEDKESDEVEEVSEDVIVDYKLHKEVMFEPDTTSDVWRMLQGYRVTIWKLIDSSGVHFVRNFIAKIQKAKHQVLGEDCCAFVIFPRILKVSTTQSKVTTVSIKISTAGTYYCLCSVSAAGYKDTTVADLQLLEDLLLNEVCTASIVQYWTRHIFVLGYQEISDRQMEKHTHSFGSRIDQDASFKGKLTD
ncbi:hypothetical protein Tco_0407658 [Tanacetum coccineum]